MGSLGLLFAPTATFSILRTVSMPSITWEGEGSVGGVRVGFGHRFAAAWVRVRAAFGDGWLCVCPPDDHHGRPRLRPRVSLPAWLSVYLPL